MTGLCGIPVADDWTDLTGYLRPAYSIASQHCSSNSPTMKIILSGIVLVAVLAAVWADGENWKSNSNYDKKPEGYFQYANIPKEHEYEFGYNRGNPSHFTSRFEQAKDSRFRTKVKWGDAYGGQGEHYFEYNHGGYQEPEYKQEYKPQPPSYAAPVYKPKYEAPKYESPKY